ncbi:MAG: hypothetical protein WC477_02260 [Patescibacteria group bacterium]
MFISRKIPVSNWKEGIMQFFKGIWSADSVICSKPEINFGGIVLIRDAQFNRYRAYRTMPSGLFIAPNVENHEIILVSEASAFEVDHALACFVHNDSKKCLVIRLVNTQKINEPTVITFMKNDADGNLAVMGMWLPTLDQLVRSLGQRSLSTEYLFADS